jgi:Protein of unknown function (DUF4238)
MPERKKRQHHVWKTYLKAWARDGQVACLMEGKPFWTDPINLAVEGDFYKLAKIDAQDEKLIRWLVVEAVGHPYVKKLNERFLELITLPMRFIEATRPLIQNPEDVEQALEIYRCNILEDNHFGVEDRFVPLLQMIYREDISFYEDDHKVIDFFQFFCMQHMRTKGVKALTISSLKEKNGIDPTRIWDIISPMLATNLGANFYLERKLRRLVLIKNTTDVEFIAGDLRWLRSFGQPSGLVKLIPGYLMPPV